MIILEGPDGAGKTQLGRLLAGTLRLEMGQRLVQSDGQVPTSLRDIVDSDLASWPEMPCQIRDRYSIISEPIYGPIIRETLPRGFEGRWLRSRISQFRRQAFVIFCLPPLPTVLANVAESEQPPWLNEHIRRIYWAYQGLSASWTGHSYTYDYTRDTTTALLAMAKQHKDRWY